MMISDPTSANGNLHAAGGYGPPGGGYPPPGGGGGFGGPPPGGGYGGPPGGAPPGGYGGPPGGGPPGGAPPGGGYGGPPPGGGFGGPPPQGFGPPGGFPPPGGPMMPGAGGDVNTTLPLVLSIVQLVVCCNLIFGGIGLLFAIQAGTAKKAGDLQTARAKAKTAMIVIIVGAVLETIGVTINVLLNAMH
ncbi:MAG: CD225/dispanin family protein [Labilithrix sp.]|nr:CD225/dispanin family protein [Labilithrix sp.]